MAILKSKIEVFMKDFLTSKAGVDRSFGPFAAEAFM